MNQQDKTRKQLIDELVKLHQRIAELKKLETEHIGVEESLQKTLEKIRKILGGIIQVITTIVEEREPYTAGHQRRTADLARSIATEMGLSKDRIDGIRVSGTIHDIGKINVPAEILNKPGPLTDLEFDEIKNHPQTGYEILKSIEFPWPVSQIVLQHHERINGTGYPSGLLGDNILLEARILGVADVVEAMSSHRLYRMASGIYVALEEISQKKDVLYDHETVDACISFFSKKGITLE